jgi:hypothetical protein
MGMTPAQVGEYLGSQEYMQLCAKVDKMWEQRFDILDIRKERGARALVTIVLEDGTKKRVEI